MEEANDNMEFLIPKNVELMKETHKTSEILHAELEKSNVSLVSFLRFLRFLQLIQRFLFIVSLFFPVKISSNTYFCCYAYLNFDFVSFFHREIFFWQNTRTFKIQRPMMRYAFQRPRSNEYEFILLGEIRTVCCFLFFTVNLLLNTFTQVYKQIKKINEKCCSFY